MEEENRTIRREKEGRIDCTHHLHGAQNTRPAEQEGEFRGRRYSVKDLNEIGSIITILEEDQPQQKSGKQAKKAKSKNGRLQQKDYLSTLNKYPTYVSSR